MKNLAEALLQKLAKWRPDSRQSLDVTQPEAGWTVSVSADHVEALGCRVWEVRLQRASPAPAADIQAQAQMIAGRITGLLEPLRLVEVDVPGGVALLRSAKAAARGDGLFYYEVLLHADQARVRRYQAPGPSEPHRSQVPFTLTHEALAKLVTDLSDR